MRAGILDLVTEQVARRPSAEAIRAGDRALTYRELAARSRAIARKLDAMGIGPESAVGLCVESSPAMVVGALGILEAGAAYVPMDPSHPEARRAAIAREAGIEVILTTATIEDGAEPDLAAAPEASIEPTTLAYVIFTSGSTGPPKGVEVEHRSLMNLVRWHLRAFDVTESDRASLLAGVTFDAAVWEVWPYLAAGASLHVPDPRVRADAAALQPWLLRERITIAFAPTALAERLMELPWPADAPLRVLLTGGDVLHRGPQRALPFRVVNNYGPTEGTVVATSGVVPVGGARRPTIGRAIDGVDVHVLDDAMREVPAGVIGELYVAGAGVARGYRNRPELTRERFPLVEGRRMYRTGDRGSYLANGEIAFLGRVDDQIQLRGQRIEPAEICAALDAHPAVAQSAVVARGDGAGRDLVAYVALVPEARPTRDELRVRLAETLPDALIPTVFVRVEGFPLTPNGKRDLSALPDPSSGNMLTDAPADPPTSPVQEQVAAILADLLHLPAVGVRENFFHLGGHSLLGAQMIARVSESLGVELSLRAVFDHPTVEDLSVEIERAILDSIQGAGA
jgi:amino acid adenylation domain-containing protein